MKTLTGLFVLVCLLSIGSVAAADVFFEEQFNGPSLDANVWRAEIATSGVRWCDSYPGAWWGPGYWVDEGYPCYGVAAYSPYGSATFSDGLLQLASTNWQAFPYVVSRLPGPVPLFPLLGDFTLRVGVRWDHVTPWGTFVNFVQTESTEPVGSNPVANEEDMVMAISSSGLISSLRNVDEVVATMPSPTEFHVITLRCTGTEYTMSIDEEVVFGPVESSLRPTAVYLGNPALAYWYPTDWEWFTVDYIRIEVPGPVPVVNATWGTIKDMYR